MSQMLTALGCMVAVALSGSSGITVQEDGWQWAEINGQGYSGGSTLPSGWSFASISPGEAGMVTVQNSIGLQPHKSKEFHKTHGFLDVRFIVRKPVSHTGSITLKFVRTGVIQLSSSLYGSPTSVENRVAVRKIDQAFKAAAKRPNSAGFSMTMPYDQETSLTLHDGKMSGWNIVNGMKQRTMVVDAGLSQSIRLTGPGSQPSPPPGPGGLPAGGAIDDAAGSNNTTVKIFYGGLIDGSSGNRTVFGTTDAFNDALSVVFSGPNGYSAAWGVDLSAGSGMFRTPLVGAVPGGYIARFQTGSSLVKNVAFTVSASGDILGLNAQLKYGDFDQDNTVSLEELQALQLRLGLSESSGDVWYSSIPGLDNVFVADLDVNNDGSLTSADVALVQPYVGHTGD